MTVIQYAVLHLLVFIMYTIVTSPNEILIKTAKPVGEINKKLKTVISDMEKTLLATTDPKGVGLAAPQVGLSIRLFLAKPTDKAKISAFINPIIHETDVQPHPVKEKPITKTQKRLLEGCLSIPNIWGHVSRKRVVTLSWEDENSKKHTKEFRGFMAIIIQHEVDHLNGILFTKHVMEQKEKLYRSYKNQAGEDEFDEIKI